jgi:hypothetical protein
MTGLFRAMARRFLVMARLSRVMARRFHAKAGRFLVKARLSRVMAGLVPAIPAGTGAADRTGAKANQDARTAIRSPPRRSRERYAGIVVFAAS